MYHKIVADVPIYVDGVEIQHTRVLEVYDARTTKPYELISHYVNVLRYKRVCSLRATEQEWLDYAHGLNIAV